MDCTALINELRDFYWYKVDAMADSFRDKVFPILDGALTDELSGYARKALQYKVIADECEPVLFAHLPFYFELGSMHSRCDGAGDYHGVLHAGGWNYDRQCHLFADQDPVLWQERCEQGNRLLYLICGPYADTRQHFIFNTKPILTGGLRSLYEKALAERERAVTDEEREFLDASMAGLLAMKRIMEKFSSAASEKLKTVADEGEKARLARIADAAQRVPWEAPRTFFEALNTLAFCRVVPGALEGIGYNTFGRPDLILLPFYEDDLAAGRLTKDEAYELIEQFLLLWDCHYDHDSKMVGYADHELENTYVLGGVDEKGNHVWNDLTAMFLRATSEHKIIFPKIKARYSASSPKAYLDAADADVIRSTSSLLYHNDDAAIPALMRAGFSEEDARDYLVTGCWGLTTNGNLMDDHGNYVNILKAFEYSIHDRKADMEACHLYFEPLTGDMSFEDVYATTVKNCEILIRERNRMTLKGKGIWHTIDPQPLTSATMDGCLTSRKDLTNGGCKYHHEHFFCVGFPNILDSLLAIKSLCFEKKVCSLGDYLDAVRHNWENAEKWRIMATKCPCWGDGSEESNALASRFNHDLFLVTDSLKALWEGGKVRLGHLTYTEVRFWGEQTLATPDGRHSGDYICQGLTPSRLHTIDSATSVIRALAALDPTELGGNTVVNILLPATRMTLDICEGFLRAAAHSAMGSLQLNCVTKEDLLDAQVHPEDHKDLIVRVCGFSARFTSLSPEWQQEVLTRNFYQN